MIRVDTIFTGVTGLPGYNSLYFEGEGVTEAVAASEAVRTFWVGMSSRLSNMIHFVGPGEACHVAETSGEQLEFFTVPSYDFTGVAAAEILPTPTQLCLNFHTGGVVAGRRVRGRSFIPGACENDNILGQPAQALLDLTDASYQDYIAEAAGVSHVVWARPTDGRLGSTHPVDSARTKRTWAVLRSRRD